MEKTHAKEALSSLETVPLSNSAVVRELTPTIIALRAEGHRLVDIHARLLSEGHISYKYSAFKQCFYRHRDDTRLAEGNASVSAAPEGKAVESQTDSQSPSPLAAASSAGQASETDVQLTAGQPDESPAEKRRRIAAAVFQQKPVT